MKGMAAVVFRKFGARGGGMRTEFLNIRKPTFLQVPSA